MTEVQTNSEIFNPLLQGITDHGIKGNEKQQTKIRYSENALKFDDRSLKDATVSIHYKVIYV